MAKAIASGNLYPRPEWSDCCWPHCTKLAEGGGPPLCPKHYRRVGVAFMNENLDLMASLPKAAPSGPTQSERVAAREAAMAAQSQVYYVRIGDHVKIGFTINMRQRLIGLRLDDSAVLATEPGGRALEKQRHQQFAAERIGRREHFNPSRRLLAHIEAVRAEHGEPKITTYKTATAA